ncbi:MAG: hypothetical protein ACXVFU_11575 [Nocardioidaceae bacterium]
MIVAAALTPHPPLLYRELAGAGDPAAELRAACRTTVERLAGGVERLVVVGAADVDRPRVHPPTAPDVRRFGTTVERDPSVAATAPPLSLGVGRRLLDEAGWAGPTGLVAVPWATTAADAAGLVARLDGDPRRTGLLVLGEGSARRGQGAPGLLDARAFPYDDALAAAVAAGDGGYLAGLDAGLADELMVLGRAAFAVLGACAGSRGPVTADLAYRDDPFGVTYLVALWSLA